jgi:hypothetical protein
VPLSCCSSSALTTSCWSTRHTLWSGTSERAGELVGAAAVAAAIVVAVGLQPQCSWRLQGNWSVAVIVMSVRSVWLYVN